MPPRTRKSDDTNPDADRFPDGLIIPIPVPEGITVDQGWLERFSKNLVEALPDLKFQTRVDANGVPRITVDKADTPQLSAFLAGEPIPPAVQVDDGPKAAAFRAMIEVAEGRIRARVDSIAKDVNEKLAAQAGLLAEIGGADTSADLAVTDLIARLDAVAEDVARLNTARDEAGGMDDISILDRLHAVEESAVEMERTTERLVIEMEEASAVLNDELAAHTATMPAPSGQLYGPTGYAQAILPAIWQVMREVEGIGKHGEMKGRTADQQYSYRTYDDQAEDLGAAFRRHGIMIQSQVTDRQYHHREINDGKQEWTSAYLTVRYQFTSLADGSTVVFEAQGEGRDMTDKATRKAMTMALKAALDQAFLLGNGEPDPDSDRPGQGDAAPEPTVRVSGNETPAARQAREAFEARQAERRRAEQDTAAETVPPVAQSAAPAPAGDPLAQAQQSLSDGLGARPVEDTPPWTAPAGDVPDDVQMAEGAVPTDDPWTRPLPTSSETTLAGQQNAALAASDENEDSRKKAERAVRAYQAASAPGVTLEKLNGIIEQANKEGLMTVELQIKDQQKPLRSWLIATGRTLASTT
jgi:hypothetical protein